MPSPTPHPASEHVREMMRGRFTFQISVDTASLAQRLVVGEAALKGRRLRARGEETRHRHRASDRRRSLNAG